MKTIRLAAIFLTVPYVAVFRSMQYVQELEDLFLAPLADQDDTTITTKQTGRTSKHVLRAKQHHVLPLPWSEHAQQSSSEAAAAAAALAVSSPRPQSPPQPTSENISYSNTVWAFLRIPKTGSTSMMAFLENYSQMHTLYNAVPDMELRNQPRNVLPCMFGTNLATIIPKNNTATSSQDAICGHLGYDKQQQVWNAVGSKHVLLSKDGTLPRIQTFTLVREPLEQLRSTFGMMRTYYNTTAHWGRDISTKEQYAMVAQGDFTGWLELLHTQRQAPQFQFQFLAPSPDEAIAMITTTDGGQQRQQQQQQQQPKVIALLNECFEASLRFLEKQYSFPTSSVDRFLRSGDFHSRKSNNIVTNSTLADAGERLRQRAKLWFADEYRFYDAAVEQFRRQWWMSGRTVDPATLRNPCNLLRLG